MKKLLSVLAVAVLIFTSCSNPANTQDSASHTEHTYGDWETVKAPTCTEKGQKKHKCTGCDKEETAEIDAKGHSFAAEWETDKDNHWHKATCGHDTEKSALGAHADSDSDGKCDACSFDMTADWPAPKFVFPEDHQLLPESDSTEVWVRHPHPKLRVPFDGEYLVIKPTITNDNELIFQDNNYEYKYIKSDCDYISLVDSGVNENLRCYIIYDELKSLCDEAHIKMNQDLFNKLADELIDIASKKFHPTPNE